MIHVEANRDSRFHGSQPRWNGQLRWDKPRQLWRCQHQHLREREAIDCAGLEASRRV